MTGTHGSLRGSSRETGSISSGTLYLIFALFSGLWASVRILIEMMIHNIELMCNHPSLKFIGKKIVSLTPTPLIRGPTVKKGDNSM